MEYIQHVLYEYGFSHKVQLLEKESIFVPAGWDSFAKIQADFENQKLTSDPDAPYDSVISIPPVLLLAKQNSSKLASASAEDDQDFLQRMFSQAQADPSGGNTTANKDVLDAMKRLGILNTPVKVRW
jgi:dynein light intermediate chain 1